MRKRQQDTPAFRAEAVKWVLEHGLPQGEAAKRRAISKGTLANWVMATKGKAGTAAPGARSAAELDAEDAWGRKELAEVRMARDI
ncbi:MAG: transposase [Betaproteobacteria bacterium]|nr:transposase [Betaproteobacteria bacterium]